MQKSRVVGIAVLAALALVLAACGGKAKQTSGEDPYGQPQATTGPEATPASALKLAQSQLGPILTDAQGRTLYGFASDNGGTSTCYDQCSQSWPPLVAQGNPTPGQGMDPSLLGLSPRSDGTQQVTYKNWPLYYFSGDQEPGQTKGQGLKGLWYVVGANGLVRQAAGQAQGYTAAKATWVKVAKSAKFGPILTDGKGRTLYALGPDKGGTPHCYLQCTTTWPPLVSQGEAKAGQGLDQTLLAVKARDDGKQQLMYSNWPLYYYAGDQAAGQTKGQGLRGIWWLIGPNGLIKTQAPQASTGSSGGGSSSGGYGSSSGGYGYGG
jgi:predicted lipoprotein with Yx(FWY)xxD motif